MITHPDKVLFPDDGITKGELAAYYEMIAPAMLPHIRGRPITMERYHRGIGAKGFFQKDVSRGFPEWLERVEVKKKGGTVHHPIVTDTRSLVWLANQNSITLHVWIARVPDLWHPDICVFDLDPSEEQPEVLSAATIALRDLLSELGLESWVKTSGSKGFHIAVPLDGSADYDDVGDLRMPPARCWSAANRSTSRRSSARRIAAVEFSSIQAAMPITPPSRRLTRCAPDRVLLYRRRARGMKSRTAQARDRFCFAEWQTAYRRQATCGRRCSRGAKR